MADDNIVNQKLVNFILKKQGASVKNAMNGYEVIDLLKENKFDVVLMDLQMPGMDGFEATRYIRNKMKNDIPIIALTADIFVQENKECRDAGMNASISKPVETGDLCDLILSLTKEKHINAINRSV